MWRICAIVSLLWCFPYFYLVKKTPANWVRLAFVTLNFLVRQWWPTCYVPAQHSCNTWIGSPYVARLLATLAEPVVLEAQAACIGAPFWDGPMGWLTITGECVSWVHIIFQSEGIGVLEDCFWMSVQVVAVGYESGPFLAGSVIFLTYMCLMH